MLGSNNQKEGYYIYKDVNGDGVITAADQEALGTGQPDMVFGLTNKFNWNNFDLSLFIQGVTGTDVMMNYGPGSDHIYSTDVWTPENRDAVTGKRGYSGHRGGYDNRKMWDASYLRLKNVRLGYTFPARNINFMRDINIYFSATNVFTITEYPGYNPDVSSGGTFAFGEGFDMGVYPTAKTYTVGVNVNF